MPDCDIVMFRQLPREQVRRADQGLGSINLARDPDAVRSVPTSTGNTVPARGEGMLAAADWL